MKKGQLLTTVAFLAFFGSAVSHAEIESMKARLPQIIELKTQGIVGEQPDGYLGLVKDDAAARAVVDAENADRKAEYAKRAATQGQTVEVLAKILGEARVRQEKAGRFVRGAGGEWSKQ